MAMTKKMKNKWLKALRSGNYKQGQETLCSTINDKREYCCLGVLCRIAGLPEVKLDFDNEIEFHMPDKSSCDAKELNSDMRKFFGITKRQMEILIEKNDDEQLSFKEIANWIEKNIKVKEAA
jgi:hypothetical protein